jgi:hypothetical protein
MSKLWFWRSEADEGKDSSGILRADSKERALALIVAKVKQLYAEGCTVTLFQVDEPEGEGHCSSLSHEKAYIDLSA